MTPVDASTIASIDAATAIAHDLSLWGLFMMADVVVKAVMISLVIASIWCWAIIFNKFVLLKAIKGRSDRFQQAFYDTRTVQDLYIRMGNTPEDPQSAVFCAAMKEWQQTGVKTEKAKADPAFRHGLLTRLQSIMNITISREMSKLEAQLPFLATVGSTAPFVGLFGTVWGIMNAFTAIAGSKNTSLAVVAPGIAEALFATALGLLAAIPAVMAYNKFSNDLNRYGNRLDTFAEEFSTVMARHLEGEK